VSHDRWFVDAFATRVWEIKDGKLTDFRGGYPEYREYKARQATFQQTAKKREEKEKPKAAPKAPKPKNTAKELAKIEKDIARLEDKILNLTIDEETYATDYQKLMGIYEEKKEAQEELDGLYLRWEELAE